MKNKFIYNDDALIANIDIFNKHIIDYFDELEIRKIDNSYDVHCETIRIKFVDKYSGACVCPNHIWINRYPVGMNFDGEWTYIELLDNVEIYLVAKFTEYIEIKMTVFSLSELNNLELNVRPNELYRVSEVK